MSSLSIDDFPNYFQEVHGYRPFPWQHRLAREVAATGTWPRLLDLPTGVGKTAALDVALFHLALEAASASRTAPMRIVYVVDRRTIVDQAYNRGRVIAKALRGAAPGSATEKVKNALQRLSFEGEPLELAILRGGIPRDDTWARSPAQPLIAISTVDQVGSRLLFRGYGVSDSMKPIHAGLLGNDCLFLLDEVHLSRPFRDTLTALQGRYRSWAERPLPDRWRIVEMSATPDPKSRATAFKLDNDDHADPELDRRLRAPKPAELSEVPVRGAEPDRQATFAAAMAEAALSYPRTSGTSVGVVVNRVASAREIARHLEGKLGDTARVLLVTGRMRPIDRSAAGMELERLVASTRNRELGEPPVFVVATQSIEAGADFDFDYLVTECSSLDSLRQRFGRLNRMGTFPNAQARILIRSDADETDPIYGPAMLLTWRALAALPQVDFGSGGFDLNLIDDLETLMAPTEQAPTLLPSHLDAWVQTSPQPYPDPEVALWLHGQQRPNLEVGIIWRADLSKEILESAAADMKLRDELHAQIESCPPSSLETLSVPIWAVRRWLENEAPQGELADVEGERIEEDREDRRAGTVGNPLHRPAILWKGESVSIATPREIRPGNVILVPSTYGGLFHGNWDPESPTSVSDLGAAANRTHRGRAVLRLHPEVVRGEFPALGQADPPTIPRPGKDAETDSDDPAQFREWVAALGRLPNLASWQSDILRVLGQELGTRRPPRVLRFGQEDDAHFVLIARRSLPAEGEDVTTEDDRASFSGVEVTLRAHMAGVGATASDFAQRIGFDDAIRADLELAGRWHDAGKADPRFQRLLHGGSEYRTLVAPEPLAKSRVPAGDAVARAHALELSQYPPGARHELLSVAMLTDGGTILSQANDPDLVLHLVGSHHGRCRPFAPYAPDTSPLSVTLDLEGTSLSARTDHGLERLDSGVSDRFWRLVHRYGWFGLAWLEAILRLADHRRSEREQKLTQEDS